MRKTLRRETAGPKGRHCRVTNPCEKANVTREWQISHSDCKSEYVAYLHSLLRFVPCMAG